MDHIPGKCSNKHNDNREEPRSTPRDLRETGPRMDYHRMGYHQQVSRQQTRFDEGLNRHYLPSYFNPYQSTLGSIPGQDLSTTLIELTNIQLRSLEMMAASQRTQQEAFQELTRVSKDKSNDSMFTSSRHPMVQTGKNSKIGSMRLTKHAEPVTEDLGRSYSKNQLEL